MTGVVLSGGQSKRMGTDKGLLTPLRNGEDIEPIIRQCILEKAKATGGQFEAIPANIDPGQLHNRSMIAIGG